MKISTEIGSKQDKVGIRHVHLTHNSDHQKTGPTSAIMYAGLIVTIRPPFPVAGKGNFDPSPVEI